MKKIIKTFLLTSTSLAVAGGLGAGGVVLVQKLSHHQVKEQIHDTKQDDQIKQSEGVIEFTQSIRRLLDFIKINLENIPNENSDTVTIYQQDYRKLSVLNRHIRNAENNLNIDQKEINDLKNTVEKLQTQINAMSINNSVEERANDVSFIYDPSIIFEWDKATGYRKSIVDSLFGPTDSQMSRENYEARMEKIKEFVIGCRAVFDLIGLQTNETQGNDLPPQFLDFIEQSIKSSSSPEYEGVSELVSVINFVVKISMATS